MKFQENDIPVNSLKELGLHDGTKNLLPLNIKEQLLRGELTEFVQLKNIPVHNQNIDIDAKLSLLRKEDGSAGLFIHPIYAQKQNHSLLSPEENEHFQKAGVHQKHISAYGTLLEHGEAKYQFDDKNSPSYYLKIQKTNGETIDLWGVDLGRALAESGKNIGDKIQVEHKGNQLVTVDVPQHDKDGKVIGVVPEQKERNSWEVSEYQETRKKEKTLLFEYDEDTRSFVGVDRDNITVLEEVNGMKLTPEQKREFKDGKVVSMPDGTEFQFSPSSPDNVKANRQFLIVSLLLDGGMSFMLYHIAKNLISVKEPKEEMGYNQGYLDALAKVKSDLLTKQAQYPDDPKIAKDISTIGKEINKVESAQLPKVELNKQDVHNVKVNDSELDDKALDRQKDIKYSEKVHKESHETKSDRTEKETREEKSETQGMKR